MNLAQIYEQKNALLRGHFLLSSGKHSEFYLQSAKVLQDPRLAQELAQNLATLIRQSKTPVDLICSPAIGGILAGYELARALGVEFMFTERVDGVMTLRRGFEVPKNASVIICEDIITTGKSANECAKCVQDLGAVITGFAALANRGICSLDPLNTPKEECVLPKGAKIFALGEFSFELYEPSSCPLCEFSKPIKPGSRK